MRGQKAELNKLLIQNIQAKLAGKFSSVEENHGMVVIQAHKQSFLHLMKFLRDDVSFGYDALIDLTAVDYLGKRDIRFEMVYMLLSSKTLSRVRIKLTVAENENVPTLLDLWKSANWPEREVYDLMGIRFDGHPLMERLIMPEGYIGHPLRKDFPAKGLGEDYLIQSILRPAKDQPATGL